ncbi:MAG: hypothetical protein MUO63_19880 [Desulfobulbaceae bacterium]|nr:hypothetical protein [Desulfobulbaceae bacterium]
MEPLSKITNSALNEITKGQFAKLPKLAITGLLDDFQYSWLRKFRIPYKFEMLDIARRMCNGENKATFRATNCKSVEDIRNVFSVYIKKWHKDDDRLILSLSFDGEKINAEWIEFQEYLKSHKANAADS